MNMKKGYISKYKISPKNKQSTSKFGLLKAPLINIKDIYLVLYALLCLAVKMICNKLNNKSFKKNMVQWNIYSCSIVLETVLVILSAQ